ncbi:MAG: tRNA (adenosine(37)-N6)-threonylcarbamoyltransferase complex dimerization subunit type 1 TsaB [Burkholderiales bacterium]|nr:tRNA (adenosine(37)-N6)-threonylcarbamoyltransferase complex dimerization subunit type 1 TsaB [Burkholderiales bacterium]
MNILALETSTTFCSLALGRGAEVFERHFEAGQRHSELVLDAVHELLGEAGLAPSALSGIAFGEGPGSFTGLRIACSLTQGLAFALSLPVVGVGTLLALAQECGGDAVIACLDARMGEVYHAAYRREGGCWRAVQAPGLYAPRALPPLDGGGWLGCGSGFAAYPEALAARYQGRLAAVRAELAPTARAVLALSRARFESGDTRRAHEAVPIYLRDKVALKMNERPAGEPR